MENIKIGDVLVSSVTGQKIEVRGIVGSIVFSRILNADGSKSMTTFDELEDLITISDFNLLTNSSTLEGEQSEHLSPNKENKNNE